MRDEDVAWSDTDLSELGEADDPVLLRRITTMVDAMAGAAGSNRRLEELSGVSEATVRNFRRGLLPRASTAKAAQLDAWAVEAVPGHPAPGSPESCSGLLARWQGRPLDATPDEAMAGPAPEPDEPTVRRRRPASLLPALTIALVVALGVAVVLLAERLLDDGSTPSGVAGVRVDRDLSLTEDNFCTWVLGRSPIPLVSAEPLVMRVDARCNAPAEPDPVLDVGSSVYDAPTNDGAVKVGAIRSGNSFVPTCWTRSSDVVTDGSPEPNESSIWIRAAEPDGWLPDVNLGGGYTEEQLTALGLDPC